MTTNDLDFGRRLAALRIRAGISQRELSKRLGMSKSYVSNVECGQINGVGGHCVPILLRELKCKLSDLFPA